jgi:hypothetical protein
MATNRRNPVKKVAHIPKSRRIDVTRGEFDRLVDLLNERGRILNDLRENQHIQFTRMAQMQAELDRATQDVRTLAARMDISRESA